MKTPYAPRRPVLFGVDGTFVAAPFSVTRMRRATASATYAASRDAPWICADDMA